MDEVHFEHKMDTQDFTRLLPALFCCARIATLKDAGNKQC